MFCRPTGGTRTASITGAYVALVMAVHKLMQNGLIAENPIIAQVAAISVGVVDGRPMLDLCYQEDSRAQTDMNLVMNQRGEFIELQGTGEGRPFTNRELAKLLDLGRAGVRAMMRAQREALQGVGDWLLPRAGWWWQWQRAQAQGAGRYLRRHGGAHQHEGRGL